MRRLAKEAELIATLIILTKRSIQADPFPFPVLKKGAAIPIRVEDPGERLSEHEGKTPGAHLLLGVGNDAFGFMTARLVSRDATGRNLEVVIPFDSQRSLVVRSFYFQLADAAGSALTRTRATIIPVGVASGQKPAQVLFRVTGAGKP